MRNLLALFGLLVIGFAGTGWYMGWYKLSYSRTTDGTIQIKTDVDAKKVESDSSNWIKNAATTIGTHAEKATQDAKTTTTPDAPRRDPRPGRAATILPVRRTRPRPGAGRPAGAGPRPPAARSNCSRRSKGRRPTPTPP